MLITARNTLSNENEKTYLTNPEVAGTNILRWRNPNPFIASWAMQIGRTGNKQSEIVLLGTATPSGTAGTLTGNTLYPHPTDTPLYAVKYDQLVFERSVTGTSGVAAPISGGTITIQPDSIYTLFDDTTGSPSYGYRTYFRNSVLNVTSTESDWITGTGFTFYSLGRLRKRVKDRLYDASFIPDDLMIDDWINEWLQMMNNVMADVNEDYALGTVAVGFPGATELGTITNTDFKGMIKRAWYTDGSGTFQASSMDSASYSPNTIYLTTAPRYYMQDDTVIGRRPSDTTGTLLLEYTKDQPLLIEDTDEIPVPMHGYSKSFVDYAYAQAKYKDNKPEEGQQHEQLAQSQAGLFKTAIAPRLRSNANYVQIVESMGSDDTDWF